MPDALPDGLGSPTKSDATVFEQFFDAQEALSRSSSMNSTISGMILLACLKIIKSQLRDHDLRLTLATE